MDILTVEFAPNALNTIKADVIRGFKSLPRRGAETGGLLCGAIVESGYASVVRIDSVVPVPVEHRFGPAYRLSETDKPNFEKAIKDWAPLGIVGWYRSQTGQGDAPVPEDRALTAEFFPARQSAFLICYPDASLNVPGKVCLWVEGKEEEFARVELGRHSLLDQALQSAAETSELAAEKPARMPELNQEPAEPVPVAAAPMAPPAPAQQVAPAVTTRNGRIALFLTLALAISFGAYLVHARLQPDSEGLAQVRPGALGMRVDRQGGSLLVSWNRRAPEILQASAANFRIVSGERSRTLALSPHELRTGSLLYTLSAEDVEMELKVSGPVGDFTESVRVVGAAPVEQIAFTPIPPQGVPEPQVRSEPVRGQLPRSGPPRSQPPVFQPSKPEDRRVADVAPKPVPAPPPQQQERNAPRTFVQPPRMKTENRALAAPPEAPLLQVASNLPPAVPVGVPGLPAPRVPQSTAAASGDTIEYVGPRAIRSVQPSVNATSTSIERAFAQTDKPHSVQVEVSIDEHGTVTSATAGASTGPFAYLFVDAALAAARRWQFEPALRGGRPVASRMTLKFDFVKHTH